MNMHVNLLKKPYKSYKKFPVHFAQILVKFKLNTSAMNLDVQSHEVFLYINVHKLYTNVVVVAIFAHRFIHTYQISFNSSST